jgi:hypothetical protein
MTLEWLRKVQGARTWAEQNADRREHDIVEHCRAQAREMLDLQPRISSTSDIWCM